ncbi:hypothetical protein [Tsukamurella soli]
MTSSTTVLAGDSAHNVPLTDPAAVIEAIAAMPDLVARDDGVEASVS